MIGRPASTGRGSCKVQRALPSIFPISTAFVAVVALGLAAQLVLSTQALAKAGNCSLALGNAAGQAITIAVFVGDPSGAPDDDNDPGTDAKAQTVFQSSGGELNKNINGVGYFTLSFTAASANETVKGFITNNLGDETCTINLGSADTAKVTYYDVATSAHPSRSGYGGSGSSGGAGDNTVRAVDPSSSIGCGMFYVFDDFEEMQACCGCPFTPDGMRTLSVVNDLTFDFGVNKGNLSAGVIEVVGSEVNFINTPPQPAPNAPGTNVYCSPTGAFSNDPFGRTFPVMPVPGGRAWITHDELQQAGNIAEGKVVQSVSVDEFQDEPLDQDHLNALQQRCAFLIQNGSGSGVCTCGVGDDVAATGRTHAR